MTEGNSHADTKEKAIRTVIADDSSLMAMLISTILGEERDFEVVGFAEDGTDALDRTDTLKPDLVIMDLSMPKMDGFKATAAIKAKLNAPQVIAISFDDSKAQQSAARRAGAAGFCSKSLLQEKLVPLIRSVLQAPDSR